MRSMRSMRSMRLMNTQIDQLISALFKLHRIGHPHKGKPGKHQGFKILQSATDRNGSPSLSSLSTSWWPISILTVAWAAWFEHVLRDFGIWIWEHRRSFLTKSPDPNLVSDVYIYNYVHLLFISVLKSHKITRDHTSHVCAISEVVAEAPKNSGETAPKSMGSTSCLGDDWRWIVCRFNSFNSSSGDMKWLKWTYWTWILHTWHSRISGYLSMSKRKQFVASPDQSGSVRHSRDEVMSRRDPKNWKMPR